MNEGRLLGKRGVPRGGRRRLLRVGRGGIRLPPSMEPQMGKHRGGIGFGVDGWTRSDPIHWAQGWRVVAGQEAMVERQEGEGEREGSSNEHRAESRNRNRGISRTRSYAGSPERVGEWVGYWCQACSRRQRGRSVFSLLYETRSSPCRPGRSHSFAQGSLFGMKESVHALGG